MATVYSLICFGGATGKAVTLTIATPCVATITKHGLRGGAGIVFSTSGALPTGITAGTTYYAKSTGNDTFNLYDTQANAIAGGTTGRINTSGTQSGTHYAKSKKMLDLFAAYPERWGSAGSERAYSGIAAWIAGRSSASAFDVEVAEIGESYTDWVTTPQIVTVPSAKNIITTTINGVRSAGWHGGNYPTTKTLTSGYELYNTGVNYNYVLVLQRYYDVLDGAIVNNGMYENSGGVHLKASATEARNNFIIASGSGVGLGNGIRQEGSLSNSTVNVITGFSNGVFVVDSVRGLICTNNFITGCTTGMQRSNQAYGFYYNNISIGNTTNWSSVAAANIEGADKNAGLSGEAWVNGTGTGITIATTDFVDFANKNFRPASASSPQVESGIEFYGIQPSDIGDSVRPSYKGGAATYCDVGPYEFDQGYGPWPATATIGLTNIVSGSRVLITKTDGTVLYNNVPGTSLSFSTSHIGDFNVVVRKATASPFYREFNASGTTVADQTTSIKCLQQLDE